ncbi:MAG: ABC transporter ATP-binding protein [Anaerolineales bacterium]|nr:MAG: ABC transporter ATP-binding protein [Anaerolineales bacterium]
MQSLRRAISYLRPYWLTAAGAIVSLVLVTAGNLAIPQLIRWVIDNGITPSQMQPIVWGALGLVGVAAVRGLFNFTQGYWSEKASQDVAFDVRNALFDKIQSLSFSYHDRSQTGQLMTRLTSDVEMVRQFTGMGLFQFINALVMLFGSAALLLLMNWRLALITLATIPLMLVLIGRFMMAIRPLFEQVQARLGALNTVLQENLAGVRVVKAFAREPLEASRFRSANQAYLEVNVQTVRAFSLNFPLIFFIFNLGTLAIVWIGGDMVISARLSLGELAAFMTYLNFMIFPMMMIGMLGAMIARATASARRIFEILDAQSDIADRPGAAPLPPIQGRVAFEYVSFRYLAAERDTLSHVNFAAEPGQTVAILGATGSGKSTIINLVPRFYDVTSGRVTVDGHDVREVTLDSLRSQIGIVLQETTLFSGTIRENIAYGRPEASDQEIIEAAQAAQAHEFILEMPGGYDTRVGERGLGLSGGQRQRIAIARALLIDPRILILDDSTSSVDAETEYQIQQALDRLMVGRTSFVIAQRISTVRNANLILVLDQGRLAAVGTHQDLLAESSLYAEILYSQLREDRQLTMAA